ncbi:ubiquitin-like-specific protease ESD4 isoform X1 [Primulina tabacum]|uniref:ubiquitin-like-specific protease ESD4 isoform X1 n=1 Tax=Primulina tabacum TaxID=48773 RepID=UPI003F59CF09
MGDLSSFRKRGSDYCQHSPASVVSPFDHFRISKKHRLSGPMDQRASDFHRSGASNYVVSRINRYPDSKIGFCREVHAPIRSSRFGFSHRIERGETSVGSKESSAEKMKILLGIYESRKNLAMESLRYITQDEAAVSLRLGNGKEAIEIDGDEENKVVVSDDSSVEEVEMVKKKLQSLNSSVVTDLSNEHAKVDVVEKMMNLMQLEHESVDNVVPAHKTLYDSSLRRNDKLNSLYIEIGLTEMQFRRQLLLRPLKYTRKKMRDVAEECFAPLRVEEAADVKSALSSKSNRGKVLVSHETSNIDITGEKFQCLRPGGWLNDEVINLYVELLKEREKRETQKFLKCHFFNSFFYKKLIAGGGYNFQSVRRWTTIKKLGYSLLDCDKIFVPIHKTNHWCLAVINKKDEKFQYLDSLKGGDNKVIKMLARYYVDEVKDKSGEDIDVSSWEEEFVEDLPEQENGYDCGMFMLKYVDFYSRDIGLCFSQVSKFLCITISCLMQPSSILYFSSVGKHAIF